MFNVIQRKKDSDGLATAGFFNPRVSKTTFAAESLFPVNPNGFATIYISPKDGSMGFHGPTAQLLEMLPHKEQTPYDLNITAESLPMRIAVITDAKDYGIPVTATFPSQLSGKRFCL